MRALVTGASGFVGRHLCEHLLATGDEVVALDRSGGSDTHGVDITDSDAVATALADIGPEVVYHLAGWSDVGGSWAAPREALRVNAEGTLNVLEASRASGVARVLVVSSADVYGAVDQRDLPITEDHPLRPTSPYAVSKVAADSLALQAHLGYGDDVIRARAFNHIGPGQDIRFFASAVAARIVANERDGTEDVPVGNLAARRDFTDVRDVVRAYRLMVERGAAGEAYNVCSGTPVPVQELAQSLLDLARRPMRLVVDPDRYRPVDNPIVLGDPSRLQASTGWAPTFALRDTLVDLLAHWRELGDQG